MSFEDVAAPAIGYAEHGFPMRPSTVRAIQNELTFFERWPGNKAYWLKPDGSRYKAGETIKLPTPPERCGAWSRPSAAPRPADGPPASSRRAIASTRATSPARWWRFCSKHDAPFDERDFADYFARIEEPARTTYRGYTVYKHGFGSQGPVLLQTLEHPGAVRSPRDGLRERRLPPHDRRGA